MDRALIIAIENYDRAASALTSKKLPGTLEAAKAFRAWLEEKWQAENAVGTIAFCSEPKEAGPGCRGATREDIVNALIDLEQEGRDQTENLYVYFSGHGFRVKEGRATLDDVIVAADFKDEKRSSDACFKLSALIEGLRGSLGFGYHFYFIDACRNEIATAIASNVMPFDLKGTGDSTVCMLQSTLPGAPALVAGPFATMLLSGLKGEGRAKMWVEPITDAMKVRFDSLYNFLKEGLKEHQPITSGGDIDGSTAVLATIKPVPSKALTITIRTALGSIDGTATVTPWKGAPLSYPITAASTVLSLEPNTYTVTLTIPNTDVTSPANSTIDLYEDGEITFDAAEAGATRGGIEVPPEPVRIVVPPNADVVLRRIGTEDGQIFRESTDMNLPPGAYESTLRDHTGQVLLRRDVDLQPGTTISPASWHGSLPHETIAAVLPVHGGSVDFSESLGGAIVDPDLSLWLALLGAGRILGPSGEYSKIGPLPLADFSAEPKDASPVYVLAGLPDGAMPLRVALDTQGTRRRWLTPKEPDQMSGIRHLVFRPKSGQCFVTFRLANQPGYTLASFAMPNRCTLIVFSVDDDGQPHVAQYLLPIRHLEQYLDPHMRDWIERRRSYRPPLQDVQSLTQLYRAFHKRQDIAAEFTSGQLFDLLGAKWLDPLGIALAAYELLRRAQHQSLEVVARNMTEFFADLPDTTAIRRRVLQASDPPHGVPLFLDGLRAFADRSWLPFHPGLIDYAGPWTAWRGAVPGARREGGGGS